MSTTASGRGARETLAVALTVTLAAFLVYWLPQIGAQLPTDVLWIYRLQVAPPEAIGPVPAGLDLFTGAPMGWLDACVAHYEAYKRLNCGDITLWRVFSLIAGDSAPVWMALTLAVDIAMVVLVDIALRRLNATWLMRLVALAGLMLLPTQTWTTPLTSEPRVGLALAGAIAAALSGRHLLAAIAMALSVTFKEPSLVWWPLVAALSLTAEARPGRRQGIVARLAPHVALGLLLAAAGGAIWVLAEARNNYPFLITTPRADIPGYVGRAVAGMAPTMTGGHIIWALPLSLALLLLGVWQQARLAALGAAMRSPRYWLPLVGAVIGLAGHLAVHWLTRREIGESRYLVPGNIVIVLMLCIALMPFVRLSWRPALFGAGALLVSAVGVNLWSIYPEIHALAPLVALPGALLGVITAAIAGGRRWQFASGALAGLAAGWLLTADVDHKLRIVSDDIVDARSWHAAVDAFTHLAPRSWVLLRTTDPLMIETVWSLEAELLFAGRQDITLWVDPQDTSFYAVETGLVNAAHDAFNAEAATRDAARSDNRPIFVVDMARNGRLASVPGPTHLPLDWLKLALADPAGFWQQRYYDGKSGYLVWTFDPEP